MLSDGILIAILAVTAAVIVYHHVGYPVLLKHLAAWRRSRYSAAQEVTMRAAQIGNLPSIGLVVPAHNEERFIARKIRNIATLLYPTDRLEVVLALDGCTDGTRRLAEETLAEAKIAAKVTLVESPRNVGKVATINACIADLETEIVALTDTSAEVTADALIRAAAHFADANVGVVCGAYKLMDPFNDGERAYWLYQTEIKRDEAALAAPVGAHGAFYLFRRSAWTPLASDTINDDFIIPMRIVAAGYSAVYDGQIVALELERTTVPQEFSRRIRIGAGNVQQIVRLVELMNPRMGWLAFLLLSGKGARPFVPFLALVGLGALLLLAGRGHAWAQWLVVGALCISIGPFLLPRRAISYLPKPAILHRYFVEGHAASLIGFLLYMFAGANATRRGGNPRN